MTPNLAQKEVGEEDEGQLFLAGETGFLDGPGGSFHPKTDPEVNCAMSEEFVMFDLMLFRFFRSYVKVGFRPEIQDFRRLDPIRW